MGARMDVLERIQANLEQTDLRELFLRSTTLKSLMDDLSAKARERGLTAEMLENLLNET